ncbi:MAG: secondary thiamine-phosphate synthase enzyme YjbQ [Pirellulales bacterium]
MYQKDFSISTNGQGLTEITNEIDKIVLQSQTEEGLCNVFIKHTSASLLIQENASPEVLEDLNNFFKNLVPETGNYLHSTEGPDDMPAHIKASMIGSSITIPIQEGRVCLGTWQGIYLCEHRDHGGARKIVVTIHGE